MKEKKKTSSKNVDPMSLEEFNKRIDLSLEDSKKGRLTESKKLLSEIKINKGSDMEKLNGEIERIQSKYKNSSVWLQNSFNLLLK